MLKKAAFLIIFITFLFNLEGETEKIGLSLSGGGARGLAHIGVLKVIDELGLEIDYITGTSMGAVIGSLYATGYSGQEIEDIIIEHFDWNLLLFDEVDRQDYYIGEKRWGNYYNISFLIDDNLSLSLPQGLISGNKLINQLFQLLYPYNHIEDFNRLPIPFACVATDLLTGETVILDSGSLHEAVRTSISIPSVFAPFDFEGRLLIDGGIRMNLPSSLARDMGADYVIGVKVTSELRERERLTNPISVLDQTINIASRDRTMQQIDYCSLLIKPELDGLRMMDFDRIYELIAAGEQAAREFIPELKKLTENQREIEREKPDILLEKIMLSDIRVEGNRHLSASKIREYTKLHSDTHLSGKEINDGTTAAYHSNLFEQVYPVIRKDEEDKYELVIKVKEKERGKFGINLRYNDRDDLILEGVIEMRNYIGNNSNLMIGASVGGEREFLVDYVKNFGREWGVYFRIFPYINEHTLYFYNEEQEKIASSNSLEYGGVLGVGAFALNRFIVEPYLYTCKKQLYRDIAETYESSSFFSSGIGIKFYYETLDELVLPMRGNQYLMKYSYADENLMSDYTYNRFYSRYQHLFPYHRNQSLRLQFEYGSYLDDDPIDFDPFYVGGFESFLGMYPYERSAPIVKILTLANRVNLARNIYLDLQFNVANAGTSDHWQLDGDTIYGGGIKLGYKSIIGPLRGGLGINKEGKVLTYISLGYDFDSFEFSRR